MTRGSTVRAVRVMPQRPPSAVWTVGNKRLCPGVSVASYALEQCLPRAAGCWVSPGPRKCAITQDPHSSKSASVIYGFVLLLATPTLICVLPTPGCLSGPAPMLATRLEAPPLALCTSGRFLLAAFSQGSPRSSPGLQTAALLPASRAGEGG